MTKSTKLVTQEPDGPGHMGGTAPVHAATFSDKHIPASAFDNHVYMGQSWLKAGTGLLRASRSVMRQCLSDGARQKAAVFRWQEGDPDVPCVEPLHMQVLLLGAFAVENGLKAVIAETLTSPLPGECTGTLPKALKGHDLMDLATRAGITPHDNHEDEALKRGQNFTEWLGRYPSPVSHDEHHSGIDIPDLRLPVAAYERLFLRCVEGTAQHTCHRYRNGSHKAVNPDVFAKTERSRYAVLLGLVDPLPPDADAGRMGFSMMTCTVTLKGQAGT